MLLAKIADLFPVSPEVQQVFFPYAVRMQLYGLARFQVYQLVRNIFQVKIFLQGLIHQVEDHHFIFAVPEVQHSIQEALVRDLPVGNVRKEDDQGALVYPFGELMQRRAQVCLPLLVFTGGQLLQLGDLLLVMERGGAEPGQVHQVVLQRGDGKGIQLLPEETHQCGSPYTTVLELVNTRFREIHGTAGVDGDAAAEVGFLFVFFGDHHIPAAIYFPVHVLQVVSLVILPVLCKFYGKPVVRAPVKADDKAFHQLSCQQIKVVCFRKGLR